MEYPGIYGNRMLDCDFYQASERLNCLHHLYEYEQKIQEMDSEKEMDEGDIICD
ncbi:MAG: hypothetical protein AB1567_13375 [bacterium]